MCLIEFQCGYCQHAVSRTRGQAHTCHAFPDGIPLEVELNEVIHDRVLPGQVGEYVYKPTEEYLAKIEKARQRVEEQRRREGSLPENGVISLPAVPRPRRPNTGSG